MNIGPIIRRLRKAQGLTLEQLALAVHVDTAYLSRLEREHQRLNMDLLEALAKELKIPVSVICKEAEGSQALNASLVDEKLLLALYKLSERDQKIVTALINAMAKSPV